MSQPSMPLTVYVDTSDREFAAEATDELSQHKIQIEQLMLKAFPPDGSQLFSIIITIAGSVATGLFTNWLYDKLKRNPNQQTVVNGQHVSGETVQIGQLIQIVIGEKKSSEDASKHDGV